jgi:DNA-binding transcriptional ArsR family regulator
MVNNLNAAFSALSDPSRRAILARLSQSERTVGELARPLPMSLPAVSKHIRILEEAGLVAVRKAGRTRRLRLVPSALAPAEEWIARHRALWEGRFDALAAYLRQTRAASGPAAAAPPAPRRPTHPGKSTPRTPRRTKGATRTTPQTAKGDSK